MTNAFDKLCVRPGTFYLPGPQVDMKAWAVVACDQYTAQPEKWEQADRTVGDSPSALRLIIPEAYLDDSDRRVPQVQAEMARYLDTGALRPAVNGMVLVERETQSGRRLGLVMTVDLEAYDFSAGSTSLIRPTEGTIVSRIPPRQKVRRQAKLELSHVLLLCDDPKRTVIEPVYAKRDSLRPLYDTDLMLDGGHIKGWAVEDDADLCAIADALLRLKNALPSGGILLASGDGNHSLATARAHWLEVKAALTPEEQANHPARFAMVELNNIYDDALIFEPIHRVLFGVTSEDALRILADADLIPDSVSPDLTLVTQAGDRPFRIGHPLHSLPVGTVQQLLDRQADLRLDYVHGEDAVRQIVAKENAVGILLPPMDKSLLFPAVAKNGPLPRKTFSMGEANEKRYYMEARKIQRASDLSEGS
ncbi:MAG: DUF1015 domain-containing protein [Clostridia bacterium]|nr:DUF1015 domain-containing protein [Clostridia bacterium]